MIREQSENNPDSIALSSGKEKMTYRELEKMSNRFAGVLSDAGCNQGDRVCLLMDKTIEAVVSLIGTIKAGAIYIPVSPKTSVQTFGKIIQESGVSWVIANTGTDQHFSIIKETFQVTGNRIGIGWVGDEKKIECDFTPEFILRNLNNYSSDPARVITTGQAPVFIQYSQREGKEIEGILFTHQNLVNCASWMANYFDINSHAKVCSTTQFHLAHSCFDLFGALAAGACLDLFPVRVMENPGRLVKKIVTRKITHAIVFPSFLEYLEKEQSLSKYNFKHLKHLMFWDKVTARCVIDYCMLNMHGTTITNLYSALKNIRRIYSDKIAEVKNGKSKKPARMEGIGMSEEVLVFGDNMTPITECDTSMLSLKHFELKLEYLPQSNGVNDSREKVPNPFSLDFYS